MIFILISVVILGFLFFQTKKPTNETQNITDFSVSILISVKYHTEYLENFLKSIQNVNYDLNLIEILIADDTENNFLTQFLSEFLCSYPIKVKIIPISSKNVHSGLKGSCLQQITRAAKGQFYYFTDCDCEFNPDFLKKMVLQFDQNTGVVMASTGIKSYSVFSIYQNIDLIWHHFMNFLIGRFHKPVSMMGTNYLVLKDCFFDLNGFENLSVPNLEDFSFLQKINLQNKWKATVLFDSVSMNLTFPQLSFNSFLKQRLRWSMAIPELSVLNSALLFFSLVTDYFILFSFDLQVIFCGLFLWIIQYLMMRKIIDLDFNLFKFIGFKILNPFFCMIIGICYLINKNKKNW